MNTDIPEAEGAGFEVDIGFDDDDYGQVEITQEVIEAVAFELGLEKYLLGRKDGVFAA